MNVIEDVRNDLLTRIAPIRLDVLNKAWSAIDKKSLGSLAVEAFIGQFSARRNPSVLKGEVSELEVLQNFAAMFQGQRSNRGVVSKEEFLDYYAGVSATIEGHSSFVHLVTTSWKLDQPDGLGQSDEDLHRKTMGGFLLSSAKGVTGMLPPNDPLDPVSNRQPPRFANQISNALEPCVRCKGGTLPKGTASYSAGSIINHKITVARHNNAPPLLGLTQKSTVGVVPNGLHNSRGFLETISTAKGMPSAFTDDVMAAYAAGRKKELALEQERRELQQLQLTTADPSSYTKSNHEHANMSIIDPADVRHAYKSRHQKVENSINVRAKAFENLAKGNSVDVAVLREQVKEKLSVPQGYHRPRPSVLQSTALSHFAEYDKVAAAAMNERYSTAPLQHKATAPTPEELQQVIEQTHARPKKDGQLVSEYNEKYEDRLKETQVVKDFNTLGNFSIINGVRLISNSVHHPRDVRTGESFGPSEVVPGQFKAMSQNPTHSKD